MERTPVRAASGALALLVAVLLILPGCSSASSSPGRTTSPKPARAMTTTTAPASTTTTSVDPAHPISVRLEGLPARISRGSAPVEFRIVIANGSDSAAFDVAPLFLLGGPPCNCVVGSLERQDPATGAWSPMPFPQGDGYSPADRAEGGVIVPAKGSVAIALRLSLSAASPPKQATATALAVSLDDRSELARSTQAVDILR